MKKFFYSLMVLVLCVSGCVTVQLPRYVQDKHPYKKQFFVPFNDAYNATDQAIKDLGWKILEVTNPTIYEQEKSSVSESAKSILILTETRQTPLFLSSRYMTLNVFLREQDNGTEIEIRYGSSMFVLIKNVKSYRNDLVVNKIFNRIEELLKK